MVGYTDNGYRLWCPEEHRIICGRNIIFDETKFEHSQLFAEINIQEKTESDHTENEEEFISAVEENKERSSSEAESVSTEEEETKIKPKTTNEQHLYISSKCT